MKRTQKKKAAPAAVAEPDPTPRVVSAVGVCAMAINPADTGLAKQVEQAMSQAVTDCLASGVSINDSQTIKAAMLEARRRVMVAAGVPED